MLQVLVVDDDESIGTVVSEILQTFKCAVMAKTNPQDAYDICRMRHFDVLVTDLNMPGMSGIELTRQLHKDLSAETRPGRIVLMTSDSVSMDDPEVQELFFGVLHKPFNILQLRECVLGRG